MKEDNTIIFIVKNDECPWPEKECSECSYFWLEDCIIHCKKKEKSSDKE